jgi:hypothetical protein
MSAKGTKAILLVGALVLFVLLFIAPKNAENPGKDSTSASKESTVSEDANLQIYLTMALKTIDPATKEKLDRFETARNFDSLSGFWTKRKRPDLAAYYQERIASQSGNAVDWFESGNRYYYSVQFSADKSESPVLYQSSIRCFKKGLQKDPSNKDARIMLASCFVEGSVDPMKGIGMLREIEKTDSNNVKLQLTFAFFSVRSGQLDKAIIRFRKALKADSTYIEAYLHLADAYEQLNKKEETIEMLEEYAARTTDITSKLEVKKYIQQLKEPNNNN